MAFQRPDARRPRPQGGSERPNFSKSDRPAGPRTPGRPSGSAAPRPDRGGDRPRDFRPGGSGDRPRDSRSGGGGDRPARDFRSGGGGDRPRDSRGSGGDRPRDSRGGGGERPGGFRPSSGPGTRDSRGGSGFRPERSGPSQYNNRPERRFDDRPRGDFDQPDNRPVRPAQDARPAGKPMRNAEGYAVPHGQPGERNRKFVKPPVPIDPRPLTAAQFRDTRPAREERPARFEADRPRATDRRDDRSGKFTAKPNGNRGFGSDRRDPRERYDANRARDDRREQGWQPDRTYRPVGSPDFRPTDFRPGPEFDRSRERSGPDQRRPAGGERGPERRFGQDRDRGPRREAPNYNLQRFEKGAAARSKRVGSAGEAEPKEGIRLNRYIANAGVCSRREADELIGAGEIRVNGEVVTEMGYIVKPADTVQYGKRSLKREKNVYVLLNKPKDYITTTEDPEERKTVMDLVGNASKERIFPVGRLDRNTTGLLLFTNDGELAQKLTHPSHRMQKIYQVELDKALTPDHFQQIREGLTLEDGKVEVDDIAVVSGNERFVGVELHSGRNRIVRRIFEHLGYDIVTLDRVQYAGLTKKDLPRGNWRFLTQQEVVRLKYML